MGRRHTKNNVPQADTMRPKTFVCQRNRTPDGAVGRGNQPSTKIRNMQYTQAVTGSATTAIRDLIHTKWETAFIFSSLPGMRQTQCRPLPR